MARELDTRISSLVESLEKMGAPVDAAMSEAVLRSMGGSPFAAALRSVAEDFAAGVWPESLTYDIVGEMWEECEFCDKEFLADGPDDFYCSSRCAERAEGI